MSYHDNACTTTHQRQRIRQKRAPYRVQAQALGVSVATSREVAPSPLWIRTVFQRTSTLQGDVWQSAHFLPQPVGSFTT